MSLIELNIDPFTISQEIHQVLFITLDLYVPYHLKVKLLFFFWSHVCLDCMTSTYTVDKKHENIWSLYNFIIIGDHIRTEILVTQYMVVEGATIELIVSLE